MRFRVFRVPQTSGTLEFRFCGLVRFRVFRVPQTSGTLEFRF